MPENLRDYKLLVTLHNYIKQDNVIITEDPNGDQIAYHIVLIEGNNTLIW